MSSKDVKLNLYTQIYSSLPDIELGYIAGIIDGEGCITVKCAGKNNSMRVILSIGSCDFELIEWLKNRIGGNISLNTKRKFNPNWRDVLILELSVLQTESLLRVTSSHLVIKRRMVESALRIRETFTTLGGEINSNNSQIRNELLDEFNSLKTRGKKE